jgi:phosphoribosylformylglycinamidine cyclo-ligase
VGATDGFLLSNTIGRNAHRIDAACIAALIRGYDEAIARMAAQGIGITMTGGETADVGDLIRTLIADSTVVVRYPREQVVDASRIRAGNRIVGLASFGQAVYEDRINSGIGSNGLTAARHLLLSSEYRTLYPESFSETIAPDQVYVGHYSLTTPLPGTDASAGAGMTAGEALLSPTRTYVPVVRDILTAFRTSVSGLIHCTGGGQVKCRDFGQGLRYVKDNLFETPAVFAAIRASGAVEPREMYQIFNMGHRMEVYCDAQAVAGIVAIAASYGIAAREVGRVESSDGGNQVVIRDRGEEFVF